MGAHLTMLFMPPDRELPITDELEWNIRIFNSETLWGADCANLWLRLAGDREHAWAIAATITWEAGRWMYRESPGPTTGPEGRTWSSYVVATRDNQRALGRREIRLFAKD